MCTDRMTLLIERMLRLKDQRHLQGMDADLIDSAAYAVSCTLRNLRETYYLCVVTVSGTVQAS